MQCALPGDFEITIFVNNDWEPILYNHVFDFHKGWFMGGAQIHTLFASNAAFQMVEIACMDHKVKLHPNNLISTMVPWIKRRHAPQFCDEILNFQCCMTSFSRLIAENWLYGSQTWVASLLIGLTVVLFLVGNSDSWSHICDLDNLVFTIVSCIKRRHMPTSSILSHKLQHG